MLEDRVKCRVACPYCSTKFSCIKIAHWAVSNFESHLKKHKLNITAQNSTQSTINSNENRPPNHLTPAVLAEINQMLDK